MRCVRFNDAACPTIVRNRVALVIRSSSGWAAFGLATVLLAACLGESPPGTHPYYLEISAAICGRSAECRQTPEFAEHCIRSFAEDYAGEECNAHEPSLERCLVEVEGLTCDEVVAIELPDSCIYACLGGPVACDDGVQTARDSPECQACFACALEGPCLAESQACDNSQACQDFEQCTDGCSDDDVTCFRACVEEYPTGLELSLQFAQCVFCDECPNNCFAVVSSCQ